MLVCFFGVERLQGRGLCSCIRPRARPSSFGWRLRVSRCVALCAPLSFRRPRGALHRRRVSVAPFREALEQTRRSLLASAPEIAYHETEAECVI